MKTTFKTIAVAVVFGTACLLALPFVAVYGLVQYTEACLEWGTKLNDKLVKYSNNGK